MERVEYVLVSQGVEIFRGVDYEETFKLFQEANDEWYRYVLECVENNEPYVDNEVFIFKERDGKVVYEIE